jgi:hypothetical protein
MVIVGEETFFKKKAFFPHTPIFKEIEAWGIFLFSDTVRSTIKPPMFALHPRLKVFARLFQKAAQSRARSPCRLRRGEIPFTALSFLHSFFLCALCVKEKSGKRLR